MFSPWEKANGVAQRRWSNMGVPHGHLDGGVPQQLLDDGEWGATTHELRGKGVAQCMPADAAKPNTGAEALQGAMHAGFAERGPDAGSEDIAGAGDATFEQCGYIGREWDDPFSVVLRRRFVVPRAAASNHDRSVGHVDVFPSERSELSKAETSTKCEADEIRPSWFTAIGKHGGYLVRSEIVEALRTDSKEPDFWRGCEDLPLDCAS